MAHPRHRCAAGRVAARVRARAGETPRARTVVTHSLEHSGTSAARGDRAGAVQETCHRPPMSRGGRPLLEPAILASTCDSGPRVPDTGRLPVSARQAPASRGIPDPRFRGRGTDQSAYRCPSVSRMLRMLTQRQSITDHPPTPTCLVPGRSKCTYGRLSICQPACPTVRLVRCCCVCADVFSGSMRCSCRRVEFTEAIDRCSHAGATVKKIVGVTSLG